MLTREKCLTITFLVQTLPQDDTGYWDGWDFDIDRWGYFQPSPDWDNSSAQFRESVSLRTVFGGSYLNLSMTVRAYGAARPVRFDVDLAVFQAFC